MAVEQSRWGELVLPSPDEQRQIVDPDLRVVAITAFFYSGGLLGALERLRRQTHGRIGLVGVTTDDAANAEAKISLKKRAWKHYSQDERIACEVDTVETALQAGVPVYTGEMKIDWFHELLAEWRPDVILVCGCGQVLDVPILTTPRYGVYNFHPTDLGAGYGAGAQPYEDLAERGATWTRWTVHQMVEEVDAGPIVGASPPIDVVGPGEEMIDARTFYDRMRGYVDPMASVLGNALLELRDAGTGDRIEHIDFEAALSTSGQ